MTNYPIYLLAKREKDLLRGEKNERKRIISRLGRFETKEARMTMWEEQRMEMEKKGAERVAEIAAELEREKNNPISDILADTVRNIKRVLKDEAFKDIYEAECQEEINGFG